MLTSLTPSTLSGMACSRSVPPTATARTASALSPASFAPAMVAPAHKSGGWLKNAATALKATATLVVALAGLNAAKPAVAGQAASASASESAQVTPSDDIQKCGPEWWVVPPEAQTLGEQDCADLGHTLRGDAATSHQKRTLALEALRASLSSHSQVSVVDGKRILLPKSQAPDPRLDDKVKKWKPNTGSFPWAESTPAESGKLLPLPRTSKATPPLTAAEAASTEAPKPGEVATELPPPPED